MVLVSTTPVTNSGPLLTAVIVYSTRAGTITFVRAASIVSPISKGCSTRKIPALTLVLYGVTMTTGALMASAGTVNWKSPGIFQGTTLRPSRTVATWSNPVPRTWTTVPAGPWSGVKPVNAALGITVNEAVEVELPSRVTIVIGPELASSGTTVVREELLGSY